MKTVRFVPNNYYFGSDSRAVFLAMWARLPGGGATTLMVVRKDGLFGFPGGKMDPEDHLDPINTIARELLEEIGVHLVDPSNKNLVHLCNHHCNDLFFTSLYTLECSYDFLQKVLTTAPLARDFTSESSGVLLFDLTQKGCENLFNHCGLALSVKEELEWLHLYLKQMAPPNP